MFSDLFFVFWVISLVVIFFLHNRDRDLSVIGISVLIVGVIFVFSVAEYETCEKKKLYLQKYEQLYGKDATELRKMELDLKIGQSCSNGAMQGAAIGAVVASSVRR